MKRSNFAGPNRTCKPAAADAACMHVHSREIGQSDLPLILVHLRPPPNHIHSTLSLSVL